MVPVRLAGVQWASQGLDDSHTVPCFRIIGSEAGGLAQLLRAPDTLPEDPGVVHRLSFQHQYGGSQLSIFLVPGNPMPSSDLCG